MARTSSTVSKKIFGCGSACSEKVISFKHAAPQAKNVLIAGSFNAWNPAGIKMKKGTDGIWRADLSLKPGRYEYKFIVDGQWMIDSANLKTAGNSFGSTNSVLEVVG